MQRLFFTITIGILLFSQTQTLHVYSDSKDDQVTRFEKDFVREIVKLKSKKDKIKININFIDITNFNDIFDYTDKNLATDLKHNSFSINEISYTAERSKKYDLSKSYMFNKYTIMTLKTKTELHQVTALNKKFNYGVVKGSIFEKLLSEEKTKPNFKTYSKSEDMVLALNKNEIDFVLSDYVDCWSLDLKAVFFPYDDTDRFCLLFPKGSSLVKDINSYISYFVKSKNYYNLVKTHFGDDSVQFFKQNNR